jgi:hypothetical protein
MSVFFFLLSRSLPSFIYLPFDFLSSASSSFCASTTNIKFHAHHFDTKLSADYRHQAPFSTFDF